jgi:hypothetical protein
MVDVEIIDAKNGQGSILVSADPEMCNCGGAGAGGMGAALAPAGHTVRRPKLKPILLHKRSDCVEPSARASCAHNSGSRMVWASHKGSCCSIALTMS